MPLEDLDLGRERVARPAFRVLDLAFGRHSGRRGARLL
jgi:hypothetical protein